MVRHLLVTGCPSSSAGSSGFHSRALSPSLAALCRLDEGPGPNWGNWSTRTAAGWLIPFRAATKSSAGGVRGSGRSCCRCYRPTSAVCLTASPHRPTLQSALSLPSTTSLPFILPLPPLPSLSLPFSLLFLFLSPLLFSLSPSSPVTSPPCASLSISLPLFLPSLPPSPSPFSPLLPPSLPPSVSISPLEEQGVTIRLSDDPARFRHSRHIPRGVTRHSQYLPRGVTWAIVTVESVYHTRSEQGRPGIPVVSGALSASIAARRPEISDPVAGVTSATRDRPARPTPSRPTAS